MSTLNKYMTRQLLWAFVVVSLTLLGLVTVVQSLRLVEFVVNRGLPAAVVFELLSLRAPSYLSVIFAVSFFLAVLFIYNKLVTDKELVVMRSFGMSGIDLIRPVAIATLVVTAAAYFVNFYLLPLSFGEFKEREFLYRSEYGATMLQAGRFNTPTDTLTIYVRERVSANELQGILIRDARIEDEPVTVLAKRGVLEAGPDVYRVVLYEGTRQEFDAETRRLVLLHFDQYSISFDSSAAPLKGDRYRKPKERYVDELMNPGTDANDVYFHDELVAEGHRRIADPLNLPALAMIAFAFLTVGTVDRRGTALRILGASLTAVAYQSTALSLNTLVAKWLYLAPLVYVLPICVMIIASIVIVRSMFGLTFWPARMLKAVMARPAVGAD